MGVARVSNKKYPADLAIKYEPDTTMHVNLKKHDSMDGVDVGKSISFTGKGIVRSINKDDMGHTMRVEIQKLDSSKGKSDEKES